MVSAGYCGGAAEGCGAEAAPEEVGQRPRALLHRGFAPETQEAEELKGRVICRQNAASEYMIIGMNHLAGADEGHRAGALAEPQNPAAAQFASLCEHNDWLWHMMREGQSAGAPPSRACPGC